MNLVVLGLGSNRSYNGFDPVSLLKMAVTQIKSFMHNELVSSVYRTKPMYVEDQDYFYNMVIMGLTDDGLSPEDLLKSIHVIEGELGRDRTKEIRFGPRSMDIDIEFFGDCSVNTPDLEIPHPRLTERDFVLKPLLEILPEYADEYKGEKLLKLQHDFVCRYSGKTDSDEAALFLKQKDFLSLREAKEVQNGNKCSGSCKDSQNLSGRRI